MENDQKILRVLGVIGLAAALIVLVMIAINSGVLGGGVGAGESVNISSAPVASGGAAAASSGSSADQPAATQTTPAKTYVVEDGDSFASIARKFNTTINNIQKLNPNIDPQHLNVGLSLVVPG